MKYIYYNLLFIFLFLVLSAIACYSYGILLNYLHSKNTENAIVLFSGLPFLFLCAIIGVKAFRTTSRAFLMLGIILLFAIPIGLIWSPKLLFIYKNPPINISNILIVKEKIYYKSWESVGRDVKGRVQETKEYAVIFYPLNNDIILYENYVFSSRQSKFQIHDKILEFINDFYSSKEKYALSIDEKAPDSIEAEYCKINKTNISQIKTLLISLDAYYKKYILYYLILAGIGSTIIIWFIVYAIKRNKMELIY